MHYAWAKIDAAIGIYQIFYQIFYQILYHLKCPLIAPQYLNVRPCGWTTQ